MEKKKPSICLVAHNAYGVLSQVNTHHAGGIEVQVPLMAKWLAANGFTVSMITWDEGFEDGQIIDDVTVFKLCQRDDGLPGLRFFMPRWSSLLSALNRANPDIVYYNCGDLTLGQIVQWARFKRKKVCYSVSYDPPCYFSLPSLKPQRERILYRYGLRHADHIIVQTQNQQDILKREWGLSSVMLPMPSAGFTVENNLSKPVAETQKRVLWIGRLNSQKRLEWLLDIAEVLDDLIFDVVGEANMDSAYAQDLKERAASIPNVIMHGRIAHEKMGQFYQNATLLCSTSVDEGFPNVYLEAWSLGIPLVTSFDPDGVVDRYGLGRVAKSVTALTQAIKDLLAPEQWQQASEAATTYYQDHHRVEASMPRFERELINMVS